MSGINTSRSCEFASKAACRGRLADPGPSFGLLPGVGERCNKWIGVYGATAGQVSLSSHGFKLCFVRGVLPTRVCKMLLGGK